MIGKPAEFGQQKKDDYTAHHYHQVSDEVNPEWDLSGAAQDMQFLSSEVGFRKLQKRQISRNEMEPNSKRNATRC